jgi:hypothetical protein
VKSAAKAKVSDKQTGEQVCGEQAASEKRGEQAASKREQQRLMQPAGCRTYMRRRLATELPEIADGFLEEAKKGGCKHIKQAMELLKTMRKRTSRRRGSAQRLLEKLSRE